MKIIKKKLCITIPAYNEERTIIEVVNKALKASNALFSRSEVLLVNDGSTDKTFEKMKNLKKLHKSKVRIVNHQQNLGFSGALKSCFDNADGDYIFLGPADGQFDFNELKVFANDIENYDIIVAYRSVSEERIYRKIYSYFYHLLSKILFNIHLKEFSTCILYTMEVRNNISITSRPSSALFIPEFLYKAIKKKYTIGQVPIHFYKRKAGKEKGSNPKVILNTLIEMGKFWINIRFNAKL